MLHPHLVTANLLSYENSQIVQDEVEPSTEAFSVFRKISVSLRNGIDVMFDDFLSVLENHGDLACMALAEQMRKDLLLKNTTSMVLIKCMPVLL